LSLGLLLACTSRDSYVFMIGLMFVFKFITCSAEAEITMYLSYNSRLNQSIKT